MLDARPDLYRPPELRRAECERHMKALRAVQRAHKAVGNVAGYEATDHRLNILLVAWQQLDAQCHA